MVPVGDPRQEHALEVPKNRVEGLTVRGRGSRQRRSDVAGSDAREDGIAARIVQVVRYPVSDAMRLFPEIGELAGW